MSHVRPLLGLKNEDQIYDAAQDVLKKKMSVREVEQYVKDLNGEKKKEKVIREKDPMITDLENRMKEKLGTGVEVKKNRIEISYVDTDDLNRILEIIGCLDESIHE